MKFVQEPNPNSDTKLYEKVDCENHMGRQSILLHSFKLLINGLFGFWCC